MSFPPNLGITNSLLLDSNYSLLFQELPSLLPQLDQISSPFSKPRMNGYTRISNSCRSKSVDFADLSLTHHTPRSTLPNSKFKSQETRSNPANEAIHNPIPEQENEDGKGEVFGILLGRKYSVSSGQSDQKVMTMPENPQLQAGVAKRSFSIRRSASVSEGYSRIHHQSDLAAEEHDDEFKTNNVCANKKKGQFFRVFKRVFGLKIF